MNAPPFEVADIVRAAGRSFIEKNRSRLTWQHLRVLRAIERCRTAALGGHLDQCSRCGQKAISYNSCRNRHCGKCQTNARDRWLADREKELLNVPYVHVVFTLPHPLSQLTLANNRTRYDLLFRARAATLVEIAADPKHLGAEIGFMSVLHTWGQNVLHHPHAHCVIPAGGLSLDHQRWIRPRYAFFLPVKVLSRVFRGKFTAGLKRAFRKRQLTFPGNLQPLAQERAFRSFLRSLFRHDWVVYAKPPFGGPQHVLHYLARYTHRVAISNHRLVNFADDQVTFRWKDYAHGSKQKLMTVTADEFLRRFLLHVLPHGFVRIRFFGFLANRRRNSLLPLCGQLLEMTTSGSPGRGQPKACSRALWQCPRCGGPMLLVQRFTVAELNSQSVERRIRFDSS
ncbi:MAG: IS91 family transposase [Acidobacteriaceae bacterium]|nr:IS91 family transposase [Acidobacteriaceae bacterium]